MFERFANSPWAVVVKSALEEARRRGDRRVGTEHLLLGVLHDPGSARALGVELEAARAALDDLDRAALAAIGIDTAGLAPLTLGPSRKRPPMTSAALTALKQAVMAAKTRSRSIDPKHLLLALLACDPPDPAAQLLAELGIDRATARNRIAQSDAPTV